MPVVLVDAGGFGNLLIDVEEAVIFVVTEGHCVITVIVVVVSPVDALRESARALRGATVGVRVVDLDDVGTTGALPLVDNLLERADTLKGGSDVELSGEHHGLGEAQIKLVEVDALDDLQSAAVREDSLDLELLDTLVEPGDLHSIRQHNRFLQDKV